MSFATLLGCKINCGGGTYYKDVRVSKINQDVERRRAATICKIEIL
jgi:hypothetical protein